MPVYSDKVQDKKSQSIANTVSTNQNEGKSALQFKDNRPEAIAQRKLKEMAENHSAQQQQSPEVSGPPIQKKENDTGLPDSLKSGIENLSGLSMDDVKVHYNSDKPAQLQAHAYAQGTDIHLGSGQEKHLPHEAWHVVQQKQGRVKPTMQMKGGVNVNDDKGLEKEADVMGKRALQVTTEKSNIDFRQNEAYRDAAFFSKQSLIQRKIKMEVNEAAVGNLGKSDLKNSIEDNVGKVDAFHSKVNNLTKKDIQDAYDQAIRYIEATERGIYVYSVIEEFKDEIKIKVCGNKEDQFDRSEMAIYWNPFAISSIIGADNKLKIASPALLLLHEMGHAVQWIEEKQHYEKLSTDSEECNLSTIEHNSGRDSIEHHNLVTNEHVVAEQAGKGDPIRELYGDAFSLNKEDYKEDQLRDKSKIGSNEWKRVQYLKQEAVSRLFLTRMEGFSQETISEWVNNPSSTSAEFDMKLLDSFSVTRVPGMLRANTPQRLGDKEKILDQATHNLKIKQHGISMLDQLLPDLKKLGTIPEMILMNGHTVDALKQASNLGNPASTIAKDLRVKIVEIIKKLNLDNENPILPADKIINCFCYYTEDVSYYMAKIQSQIGPTLYDWLQKNCDGAHWQMVEGTGTYDHKTKRWIKYTALPDKNVDEKLATNWGWEYIGKSQDSKHYWSIPAWMNMPGLNLTSSQLGTLQHYGQSDDKLAIEAILRGS